VRETGGGRFVKNGKRAFAWVILIVIMTSGVLAVKPSIQSAAAASPGSDADPLVSKSYVDSKLSQLITMINGSAQSTDINAVTDKDALKREIIGELAAGQNSVFIPIRAVKGQIILGGEGSEIVLRSGRAAGYCGGENGMVDVTAGAEVFNGSDIPLNHLLLVPRDDGRGVAVTSDEAWLVIKGVYQTVGP